MVLPNLVYIGMGKSGSTLLHKLFLKHPDFCVSQENKEINFFGNNKRWSQGIEWYETCFSGYSGERYIADISPGYHHKSKTRERLVAALGKNTKILFTFRRFTDFAYSRYLQKIRSRRLPHSFLHELDTLKNFYAPLEQILDGYIKELGRENILLMNYEQHFDYNKPTFEQEIYGFLGLNLNSYYKPSLDSKVNKGYVPRYVYSGKEGYEEEFEGKKYSVPPNTLVYCNGRGYQNIHWDDPSLDQINQQQDIESNWTTCLSKESYQYVQEKYTMPLAKKVFAKIGWDLRHWDIAPKEIKYGPAPLPDNYLVNKSQFDTLETTPWG